MSLCKLLVHTHEARSLCLVNEARSHMHEARSRCLPRNGQNHGFARAIEISRFFRDLILLDVSEMNNTVGFIFISASKRFSFVLVCFQHSKSMQSVSSTF